VRRTAWAAAGAILALAATTGVVAACGSGEATRSAGAPAPTTVPVERGRLAATVSGHGTLIYRARPDGSPYVAINRAGGIYTALPAPGDRLECGDVLYRVDDDPVRLLCGRVPAYRDLEPGDRGTDVRQLNRNLRALGYAVERGRAFTARTERALEALHGDGRLELADAVFLPRGARIAEVSAELGGTARPGAPVAQATSDTLEVRVDLAAWQRGEVRPGDPARVTLPGNRSARGTVDRLGRVARSAGPEDAATIPAAITLDEPDDARGLDRAPVQVDIATKGVERALSVPVTAVVGKAGGGFAVEVVRDGGRRELVAVELGLFDTAAGRVEVEGGLDAGDRVVVPTP
jgi:hypothetical protein